MEQHLSRAKLPRSVGLVVALAASVGGCAFGRDPRQGVMLDRWAEKVQAVGLDLRDGREVDLEFVTEDLGEPDRAVAFPDLARVIEDAARREGLLRACATSIVYENSSRDVSYEEAAAYLERCTLVVYDEGSRFSSPWLPSASDTPKWLPIFWRWLISSPCGGFAVPCFAVNEDGKVVGLVDWRYTRDSPLFSVPGTVRHEPGGP